MRPIPNHRPFIKTNIYSITNQAKAVNTILFSGMVEQQAYRKCLELLKPAEKQTSFCKTARNTQLRSILPQNWKKLVKGHFFIPGHPAIKVLKIY